MKNRFKLLIVLALLFSMCISIPTYGASVNIISYSSDVSLGGSDYNTVYIMGWTRTDVVTQYVQTDCQTYINNNFYHDYWDVIDNTDYCPVGDNFYRDTYGVTISIRGAHNAYGATQKTSYDEVTRI